MKKITAFLLFIILFSCEKDDNSAPIEIINSLDVSVNGTSYKLINENIGGNENCDALYISTFYYEKDKIQFRLKFDIKKNGELKQVWYDEYDRSPNAPSPQLLKIFLTPNFNPLSTFSIENFEYNPLNNNIKFDFSGTVFLENQNHISRELSGSIGIKSFNSVNCSVVNTGIEYFSENINLNSYHNYRTKYNNQTQLHRYFSNNGYRLEINIEQDFWNFPVGTAFEFEETSVQNKVSFYKYIGNLTANQNPTLNLNEWKNYDTRGNFIIEEKIYENGHKKIVGKINMEVLENNETNYTISGLKFSTGSFE